MGPPSSCLSAKSLPAAARSCPSSPVQFFDKLAPLVQGKAKTRPSRAIGRKRTEAAYPVAAIFEPAAVKTADTLWGKIEIGSVVLASQPEVWGPGWWEG